MAYDARLYITLEAVDKPCQCKAMQQ